MSVGCPSFHQWFPAPFIYTLSSYRTLHLHGIVLAPSQAATTGYEDRRERLETTTPVTGAAGATGMGAAYPEVRQAVFQGVHRVGAGGAGLTLLQG